MLLVAGLALGGAAIAGGEQSQPSAGGLTEATPRALSVRMPAAGALGAPGLTVAGGKLLSPSPTALAAQPIGPLMGWLAPVAVSSPDGVQVVYSTWRQLREDDPRLSWSEQGIRFGDALGLPSLRRYDRARGADSLVEKGAFSAAWRRDGALAYLRGSQPHYGAGRRYVGDVVVRERPTEHAVVWSNAPDRYVVSAWAGRTLIAYRMREGEQLDLIAFDGARQQRVLAADSELVAVAPDGRSVFVNDGAAMPSTARVLDVATGHERSRFTLGEIAGVPVPWVGYSGSWTDDMVVAGTDSGLVVFRVGPRSIRPLQVLQLDPQLFPHGAVEPVFVGGGGRFVARADVPAGSGYRTVLLDCRLSTATCMRGDEAPEREWLRYVFNPSRPERDQ
jgi:hypothetical protein